jgi:hypothetical protein
MKSSDGSKINQNQLWFFSSTRQRRERKTIREEKYSRLDGEKMESTALVVPCSIHSYRGECGWRHFNETMFSKGPRGRETRIGNWFDPCRSQ